MQTHQEPNPFPNDVQRDIVVRAVTPDDASWAWSTLQNLVPDELTPDQNPGDESIIEIGFKYVMEHASRSGILNAYANPAFCVSADVPSTGFFREARRAQAQWFQQVREILGTSGRVKRTVRQMTPIVRQLTHTGVLVVEGKHVMPNRWPDQPPRPAKQNLFASKFGRLTVQEQLRKRRVRCICDCGNEVIVLKQKVLKSRVTSCGCDAAQDQSACQT